jgi:hypothetical protein
MEILREGIVTPQRVHALLKTVKELQHAKREAIQDILQPRILLSKDGKQSSANEEKQNTINKIITQALRFNLIIKDEQEVLRLAPDIPKKIEDSSVYRQFLQSRLCGVDNESEDNYILNCFTAWFAVQNEKAIISKQSETLSEYFNQQMFPSEQDDTESRETRKFNSTKYNGWLSWASFLGWVRKYDNVAVPDATNRLLGILNTVLNDKNKISITEFIARMSEVCPELDDGNLFIRVWESSRPTEEYGKKLTLMLSTALRTCEKLGYLELTTEPDASDVWQLYDAEGKIRITHIRRRN